MNTDASNSDAGITRASRLRTRSTDAVRPRKTDEPIQQKPIRLSPVEGNKKKKAPNEHRNRFMFLVIGMTVMLLGIVIFQQALGGFTNIVNDFKYGTPRTYQTDAFVGHETGKTPSHFIALNNQGRIEIIEFPGGDGTQAHIYIGPQLAGSDAVQVPVTLRFVDTNHNHHPDMIVITSVIQVTLKNTGKAFEPQN